MFEIFDIDDTTWLEEYEDVLTSTQDRIHKTGNKLMVTMPQFEIRSAEFILGMMSHYDHVYKDWIRVTNNSYVFRFEPDKPTMLPHIDVAPETCEKIKGFAKRVMVYANKRWDNSWQGGTYFAPFEKFSATKHFTAKVPRDQFAAESTLVHNKPGRMVVFDPDEWHMPQMFSGNDQQRLVFGCMFVHPDQAWIAEKITGPDNENGKATAHLDM